MESAMPRFLLSVFLLALALSAQAQTQAAGVLVVVPAYGTVHQANDRVRVMFTVEEQDRDKAQAASRVNQKMKEGTALIRREDPQAVLRTQGYYTYPVYPDEQPVPAGTVRKPRVPTGWRAGQSLEVTTTNLEALPRTVAAAQRLLSLNGIDYSLSEQASRRLDEQRIANAYRHLQERIAAIARAMGRPATDAAIESIDFEASGAYAPEQAVMVRGARAMMAKDANVVEPSFEPGETTQEMRIVGKVRFK
jgi:predicted secreted protein